jgi:hypothetical protein
VNEPPDALCFQEDAIFGADLTMNECQGASLLRDFGRSLDQVARSASSNEIACERDGSARQSGTAVDDRTHRVIGESLQHPTVHNAGDIHVLRAGTKAICDRPAICGPDLDRTYQTWKALVRVRREPVGRDIISSAIVI